MNKFKILSAILIFSVSALIACGGADSGSVAPYEMKVLPSKYSIDIPASLVGSFEKNTKSIQKAVGDPSNGCSELKFNIAMMKGFATMPAFFAVIADYAISQNNITPDGIVHSVSVTFTQGMANALSTIISDEMITAEEASAMVGYSMPIKLTYKTETGVYAFSVKVEFDEPDSGGPTTISWSTDKTATKLSMACLDEQNVNVGSVDFIYSDTDKIIKLIFNISDTGMDMNMSMSLKEQGTGALFYSDCVSSGSGYKFEGFADDNGGYIKSVMFYNGELFSTSEEYFDAEGMITSENSTYAGYYTNNNGVITMLQTN